MQKILVLRFSSIGDIVLTSPVVRCLKTQGRATVHFLTKKQFTPIFEACPYIDKQYSFEKDYTEVLDQLKAENYDYIVDLHHNLRTMRLKWQLGRPASSFPKLNLQKWLLVNLKWDILPEIHIVDRYFEAVRPLGIQNDGQGLSYWIPPDKEVDPGAVSPQFQSGYIVFSIGATHATKRLPTPKIADICRQLDMPVLLLGGKAEFAAGAEIARAAGRRVINGCGATDLHQSASLIRQAHSVITHDTGLMHIAAAFRKRIVSIWGSTTPRFGMYPYDPTSGEKNTLVQVNDISCRPCSKIGYDVCPKGHFDCMNRVEVQDVLESLNMSITS